MSKVQKHFHLCRPLDKKLMTRLADVHSVYGILRITVAPSLDQLTIEYDASRLKPSDVEAALSKAGIPIQVS